MTLPAGVHLALAFDSDRIARFDREAKVLASLNHPHIAALHGMEQAGEQHSLIMELWSGSTGGAWTRRLRRRREATTAPASQPQWGAPGCAARPDTVRGAGGQVSPDGQWLAYESNESGTYEIYVRPFPSVDGGRWQVSTGGGVQPLWARSSQELFYLAPTGALMRIGAPGATWAGAVPAKLFEGRYVTASTNRTYDIAPDCRRFLMIKEGAGSQSTPAPGKPRRRPEFR